MEKIPTGSKILDKLLDDGYEKDIITTIYGPAGSGKTNLCILCAMNTAREGKKVIYIDPGVALSYFNLGNIYLHQKKMSSAQKEFENVRRLLEKRQPEEMVEFSNDFTADYLLRACENNLAKIVKSLV